ncbi:MAG: aminoglycoside 6-adenylyltransferase [Firmicutes bacterium]|nr:aminoglycoside 6-adenylyltransferase [Bacillota bacterium]
MRTEKEMFDLILNVAKNDERIRAVYMNGSRANPNVSKDIFQDYDIVFLVTETKSFLNDKNWIIVFGKPAIIQEPDRKESETHYTWLMLFKDRNRIDLHIRTKEYALKEYTRDSLTVLIIDKDNCLPGIPPTNDSDYYVKKPEESQYKSRCNDFWWCLQNVAKGIARDQLPYAMWMYNVVVRENMTKLIDWYIGINTNFSVSVGMSGKYYKKYLPKNIYSLFLKTYSGSDYNDLWTAIFNACELFRSIAPSVGNHFGFTYNQDEDTNIMEYLNWVKLHVKISEGE